MHKNIKCPHCGRKVNVDLDYDTYYHEECGNDIILLDEKKLTTWLPTLSVEELVKQLESIAKQNPNAKVYVPCTFVGSNKNMGASPAAGITVAYEGFDWDMDRVLLLTNETLETKDGD